MDFRQAQADIMALLGESPIVRSGARADVKQLVYVGEIGMAFDTLCSWLYEDSLAISRDFYQRLLRLSADLEEPEAVERLDELVTD
ncbi:MafI family immunity protein [Actinoallomurus sp. CA-142502]|uniref:MafI family immunity protein n=1 Tax=Actinoallomurus sp. CA-142502 TaxID=3239885 RepID=UPI003D89E0AF